MSKHVKIGEWIFEVKMVRALKVAEYGQPYTAIANCNINGDSMYIDGLLTKAQETFTKDDFDTFTEFSKMMNLEKLSYHRYQHGKSEIKNVDVETKDIVAPATIDSVVRLVK